MIDPAIFFFVPTTVNKLSHFARIKFTGLAHPIYLSLRLCVSAVKKFRRLLHNLDLVKLADGVGVGVEEE
jgi:hypothetical protein